MKFKCLFFLFLTIITFSQSSDSLSTINKRFKERKTQAYKINSNTTRIYYQPKWYEMVTNLPKDFMDTNRDYVAKDHAWYLAGSIGATVAFLPLDQYLVDESRNFAQSIGLSQFNSYGNFGPLNNIPKNIGAALYLIGNGTTVILMSAGLLTYAMFKNDYRAYATASGLMESIALSGIYVQAIKRITGRESPFIARANGNPGGDWNPFPSFVAYAKFTPKYDAVPSGHLATIMSALTVVTTNYPNAKWIKPVGYSALGIMCFQMMQSQVHWFSDYPIALLIGYFTGKNIAKNRFIEKKDGQASLDKKYKIEFLGGNFYGYQTLGLQIKF